MNVFPGPESRLRSKTVLYIITINIIVIVQNPYLRIILTSLIDNCLIVWLFWISFKESLFQRAEPPISGLFWHLWLFDYSEYYSKIFFPTIIISKMWTPISGLFWHLWLFVRVEADQVRMFLPTTDKTFSLRRHHHSHHTQCVLRIILKYN